MDKIKVLYQMVWGVRQVNNLGCVNWNKTKRLSIIKVWQIWRDIDYQRQRMLVVLAVW